MGGGGFFAHFEIKFALTIFQFTLHLVEAVFHCPSQFLFIFSSKKCISYFSFRNECGKRRVSFFPSIYTSPFLCLSESNLRLNGLPLYPVPPASSIHHTTTRTCTLPLRGPLNQALHMSDPHLLLFFPPPLLLSPSPAHTLASALWLLLSPLPRCHLPQHNRVGKSGQRMGGRTRREIDEDTEERKNGTTVKVRGKRERESAYS